MYRFPAASKASEPEEWQHVSRCRSHVKITCSLARLIVLLTTVKRETRCVVAETLFGGV